MSKLNPENSHKYVKSVLGAKKSVMEMIVLIRCLEWNSKGEM